MKLSEAKKIVGKMVKWSMLSQGVPLDEMPEPITEDLQTLLRANRIVDKSREISTYAHLDPRSGKFYYDSKFDYKKYLKNGK